MTFTLAPNRSRREARLAVLQSLSVVHWRRVSNVARATRLPAATVRRQLHGLAEEMLVVGSFDTPDAPFRLTQAGLLAAWNVKPTFKKGVAS